MILFSALWVGWGFLCALGIRVGFAALFRRHLGKTAGFAAYAMCGLFFVVGLIVVSVTGVQMYGFDAADPAQMFGYLAFLYSPIGLPTLVGIPLLLVAELVWAASRPKASEENTSAHHS